MDFCKPFDMVNYNYLWEALHKQGMDKKVLTYIYSNAIAYIRLDQKGAEFKLEKGVKQGDPFSPIYVS